MPAFLIIHSQSRRLYSKDGWVISGGRRARFWPTWSLHLGRGDRHEIDIYIILLQYEL